MYRSSRANGLSRYFPMVGLLLLAGFHADAQTDPIPPPKTPGNSVTNQASTIGYVRVKASPDECYAGLGLNVKFDFINQTPGAQPCPTGKQPKVDQSYLWGIVPDGNTIWFGTTSNGQCITEGGLKTDPTTLVPYQTDSWACEFQKSPYTPSPLPIQIGDFRPPRFYMYDRTAHTVKDITPKAPYSSTNPLGVDQLWQSLRGARASTIIGGRYVVVGGPALSSTGALTFFVWDKTLSKWIIKTQIPGFDNIRRFVEVNGVSYAGVGRSQDGGGTGIGGNVIRLVTNFTTIPPYVNGVIPVCSTCVTLQPVGNLDGEGAYLAVHNNRIFITTWPKPGNAGLFMGPPIPDGGYTAANATQWTKVWKVETYDPDPVIASSWAGGAVYSYGGYLWWGTMNVPLSGPGRWSQVYGQPATQADLQLVIQKAWRSTSLFRSNNFDTSPTPTVQLLYGESQFNVYTPPSGSTPGVWNLVNNASNLVPMFGSSGFDNTFNNYIWSMNVWNNKLYVGTMDWSYLAEKGSQVTGSPIALTPFIPVVGGNGADMWVFSDTVNKATPETTVGFGNPTNYGIRNIIPIDSTHMFITMSNAMNLLTKPGTPNGGWELIEVMPRSSATGGR